MRLTNRGRHYSLQSIQFRLPLLICFLLLTVILIFSWTSYIGIKKVALDAGRQRLKNLAGQLSTMFHQSAISLGTATQAAANNPAITGFFQSGGKLYRNEALEVLQKILEDTTSRVIVLLDTNRQPILRAGPEQVQVPAGIEPEFFRALKKPDYCTVGKIYALGDSMYYPILAGITANNKLLGYIVRWRRVMATPKSIQQLSQLIGADATLYFGNKDGKFWTDMIRPVEAPPVNRKNTDGLLEYTRKDGGQVIAALQPVAATGWLIMIEFSKKKILAPANQFLSWIILAGVILVVTGILAAWIMSRKITRPLRKLTRAVTAIAEGDYSFKADIGRRDELGQLAGAFNAMTIQVRDARNNLEKKVQERTTQLQAVNKELEAFSYSVSHDLRAPLRAIGGYSSILKEDYCNKLDAEANRMLDAIGTNTVRMGSLIDDLLEFSRLNKKGINCQLVNMNMLAESCMEEILHNGHAKKYEVQINPLPGSYGDTSLLKQVWFNLISNAVKYSSTVNRPKIEIGCTEDASSYTYYICDNGVGFDMKYVHKLFGVFQRLHSQDEFEGTGVGLALVKRIINKHGGDVWAESMQGKGATFYFSIQKA